MRWGRWRRATVVYVLQLTMLFAVYALLLVVSIAGLQASPPAPWRQVLALLPVVPLVGVAAAVVRLLGRLDELERRIQLEALGMSFCVSALSVLAWGFLQLAGLPPLNPWAVFGLMMALWLIGVVIGRLRYR